MEATTRIELVSPVLQFYLPRPTSRYHSIVYRMIWLALRPPLVPITHNTKQSGGNSGGSCLLPGGLIIWRFEQVLR